MWYDPPKYGKPIQDINKSLLEIKGEMEEKEARITLAKFLYRNLGLTAELLTGVKLYPDQIINIKGMLNSNYTMCVWGRGLGKTIVFNDLQLLITDKGPCSLTSLFSPDFSKGDHWHNINPIKLWNGHGYATTDKILVQPKKACSRLKTKMGYSLEGSSVHKIKVWDSEKCEVVWKTYDKLKSGDFVCIDRNPVNWNSSSSTISKDQAYFCGLAIGDGCYSEKANYLSVTSMDKEIIDFCAKSGGKVFKSKIGKAYKINFSKEFTSQFLKLHNFEKSKSYNKYIPDSVLSSKETLTECLKGLFDTDGGIENYGGTVSFSSTSKKLAHQVHVFLLMYGIVSKMKEKKTSSPFGKTWIINISGQNAKRFYEEIGFNIERKQNGQNYFKNKILNTNVDIIPNIKKYCQEAIKSKIRLKKEESIEWRQNIRRKENQKDISYQTLIKYVDFFKKVDADKLEIEKLNNLILNNFFFDKIVDIEDIGEQNCIDFNVPDGEMYWGNGFINHNTFSSAMYCILQTIFFPGSNILIAGPTFRTARFIFNHIEKICDSQDAKLLFQAMGVKSKRNDEFRWKINEGEIVAIPLNGEKIRGFRANILVIDEFLLMNEEIVEKVLMPFLVAPQDIKERQIIRAREDELIRRGVLKESERIKFENKAKMIGLSSASYTCEYLYKKYDEFVKQIYSDDMPENGAKYFVSQLAWDAIPLDRIDKSIIELAQGNESNQATFKREYGAQFIDGSDSYFSMKKMIECTIPDGETPTLLVQGSKEKKYILSIDPNFSNSPTADNFAMCLIEIDEDKINENKISGTVVHNYAKSGKDLKDHIKYFYYLWKNFNIEMIIIDYAGYQFLESANESEYFKKDNVEIKIFEFYPEKDGSELEQQLRMARKNFNKEIHRIAFTQYFTTDFIRKGNEHLQGCIDYKKIWFGAGIKADGSAFDKAISAKVDLDLVGETDTTEFIDSQEILLKQMKYECASIEVKSTAKGTQSFDLPQIMKRDSSSTRMRRDSYTALMLGCWGLKCYFDIVKQPEEDQNSSFQPMLI